MLYGIFFRVHTNKVGTVVIDRSEPMITVCSAFVGSMAHASRDPGKSAAVWFLAECTGQGPR
jgi:hypothetical protein